MARCLPLLPCLALLSAATPGVAAVVPIQVTSTNDAGAGSLRAAILAAVPGDTINLNIAGTIVLASGELVIDKDLKIVGPGFAAPGLPLLTIRGNGVSRVFNVSGQVLIAGVAIANGNSSFSTSTEGGGILNSGDLVITNCNITDNLGRSSGGIHNLGNLLVQTTTFLANLAASGGGAIGNQAGGVATITNCLFFGNETRFFSGGAIANSGTLTIQNSVLIANKVLSESDHLNGGGAIANTDGGTMTVTSCNIGYQNLAPRGGGLLNLGNITNSVTTLTVVNSTIYQNTADRFGGGLMNLAGGGPCTVNVINSTISANTAAENGTAGGVDNSAYVGNAIINLVSCTVALNGADSQFAFKIAGGIYCGNFSPNAGDEAAVTLTSTLVADNTNPQSVQYRNGTITSFGHNLFSDNSLAAFDATDLPNTNANLVAQLGANGGPILAAGLLTSSPTLTHALLTNSPAIDHGISSGLLFDQRGVGFPRTIDNPAIAAPPGGDQTDIGAFEAPSPAPSALRIANVSKVGTDVQIKFTTSAGRSYRVEYTGSSGTTPWTPLPGVVVGTGSLVTVTNSDAAALPQRFYRVRMSAP
jgi:hypothetical protein